MKRFLTAIVIILSITFTQTTFAKASHYETTSITSLDGLGIDILQNADATKAIGNYQDGQGLHVYNASGCRYLTSDTSCRYSEDITINQGAVNYTYTLQEQSGNSIDTQSWGPDRSLMCLRRAQGSGTSIQGNYNQTATHYRATAGNHHLSTKGNTQAFKAIHVFRDWSGSFIGRYSRDEAHPSLVYAKPLNPIPNGWFLNLTIPIA